MRKLPLLLLLAGMAALAHAKKLTVQHFEQILAQDRAKPDADLARELADLELTERVSPATLEQWQAEIAGPKARLALAALTDAAAFLAPPAAEFGDKTTPEFATQRRIMSLGAEYVGRTIPKAPNFYANRDTIRFEDRPAQNDLGGRLAIGFEPIHAVSGAKSTVLYRDGREVVDTGVTRDGKTDSQESGLNAWGLFGPILGTVLVDAGHGTLTWSHWERSSAGPVAVFRYIVPHDKSNYEVSFCCNRDNHAIKTLSAYHGEIAIDPATGAILRMTLMADLPADSVVQRADIEVEYGPVEIGGISYLCPVRSISIYKARMIVRRGTYRVLGPFKTMLNDVTFSQYHLFRAETRILTAEESQARGTSVSPGLPADKSSIVDSQPAGASGVIGSLSETAVDSNLASASTDKSVVASAPDESGFVPGTGRAEISVTDATELPDSPASGTDITEETDLTPRVRAREVGVSVTASDKAGHSITDLKREDFEIDDDGDPQTITSFLSAAGETSTNVPAVAVQPVSAPTSFSNHPIDEVDAARLHSTIFIADEAHLSSADAASLREAILRLLPNLPADERVGLYAIRDSGYEVLEEATTDRTAITAKVSQWPGSGENSAAESHPMQALIAVARHLAAMSGHKNLVSIGNSDPGEEDGASAANADKHVRSIDEDVLRAPSELSDAGVTFYSPILSREKAGASATSSTTNNAREIEAPGPAQATGGRTIHGGSDLAAELIHVVDEGRASYRLSFTPDVPPDGQFHLVRVKLKQTRDVTLRYRAGYFYEREPATLKQSFRDAIWQQKDASEIAVGADIAGPANQRTVKLHINAADLTAIPLNGVWVDKVDVYLAERNDGQQKAEVTGKTLELNLQAATYQKYQREGIPFEQLLTCKPETTSVRIVVVDRNSGRMGSITLPAVALQ